MLDYTMNYDVPQFQQMEDDYSDISSDNHFSGFSANEAPAATAAATSNQVELMELLCQDGNLAFQMPSGNIITTSPLVGRSGNEDAAIPAELAAIREFDAYGTQERDNFFMQENEMGSWLQYPIEDSSLNYEDLLHSAPPPIAPTPMTVLAEIHDELIPVPAQHPSQSSPPILNFGNFLGNIPSSYNPSIDSMSTPPLLTKSENYTAGESSEPPLVAPPLPPPQLTIIEDYTTRESSQPPLIVNQSIVSLSVAPPPQLTITENYTAGESSEPPLIANESIVSLASPLPMLPQPTNSLLAAVTCNLPASSSLPGGSGMSLSDSGDTLPATPKQDLRLLPPLPPAVVDRKRKGIEADHAYRVLSD